MDHKHRFMNWRKRMPQKTQYLADRVLARIVPEFEKHGFVWYPDFAENNVREIGANEIPFQKREGAEWPTVQIMFVPKGPFFRIDFSALPAHCRNPISNDIPQSKAIVSYGPAYFSLCSGTSKDRQLDAIFGFDLLPNLFFGFGRFIRYLINWRDFFDSEVDIAMELLPYLFEVFDKALYREWLDHPFGYVNEHVFLLSSWKIREVLQNTHRK